MLKKKLKQREEARVGEGIEGGGAVEGDKQKKSREEKLV